MRRMVAPDALPEGEGIVCFEFEDLPESMNSRWLVCDGIDVNVCMTDPGMDVQLYVLTDLETLTAVWRGDISVTRALDEDRIELQGPTPYRRSFRAFLGPMPWTRFKSRVAA